MRVELTITTAEIDEGALAGTKFSLYQAIFRLRIFKYETGCNYNPTCLASQTDKWYL